MRPNITEPVVKQPRRSSLLRRCYDWTMAWAGHPNAQLALFFIAIIEASVFPVPPDVLLLALALGRPDLSLRFAFIATAGSTIGAVLGFGIGMFLFSGLAEPMLEFYGVMAEFDRVQALFTEYGLWLVLIAGFSPIPFKVITITAGFLAMPIWGFIGACILSRGLRFGLEGAVMRWGGEKLRGFVEKHLDILSVMVVILVGAGFIGLWLWQK